MAIAGLGSKPMTNLIGIAGPAGAGKDELADMLLAVVPGSAKRPFAEPLKTMLEKGLGLTQRQLYGDLKADTDERYGTTPRHMMQTLGTEWGRNLIAPDLWLSAMANRVSECDGLVVIPDVRFEDEAAWVRERGKLIHITGRGGIPGDHVSERGVVKRAFDMVVDNSGSKYDLQVAADTIAHGLDS